MPGPTQLITDVAKIDRQFAEREQQRQETLAAYEEGGLAYHAAIKFISDEPAKEAAARELFESGNPHRMVSYADEGHKRPAWFRGLNDAMAALYGVATPRWQHFGDRRPEELNGRVNGAGTLASYEAAVEAAVRVSREERAEYWAEDRGASVSPRYAVIRAFHVGEPVSYGFNGDSYVAGRIVAMSKTAPVGTGVGPRIITVQDHHGKRTKFWRRRLTGSWVKDGMWSLQHGWHSDRNPSF